jgi:hypothetical protein
MGPDKAPPTSRRTSDQGHNLARAGSVGENPDIFEGTEQFQELVIAPAITGLRIE